MLSVQRRFAPLAEVHVQSAGMSYNFTMDTDFLSLSFLGLAPRFASNAQVLHISIGERTSEAESVRSGE